MPEGKIVIYGRPNCEFCDKAKRLARSYQYIDVRQDPEAMKLIKDMGATTVPQIFIGDKHIGGFEEMKKLPRFN